MRHEEAVQLIRNGVKGEVWADLGAGTGTFTRALGELLGVTGSVWAVDQSAAALRSLHEAGLPGGGVLHVLNADFTDPLDLPGLDGILIANALHFFEAPAVVIRDLFRYLRPGGILLLVEYDREVGNPWVPHPIPLRRFHAIAAEVGLLRPREVGRRSSAYRQDMYAAVATIAEH